MSLREPASSAHEAGREGEGLSTRPGQESEASLASGTQHPAPDVPESVSNDASQEPSARASSASRARRLLFAVAGVALGAMIAAVIVMLQSDEPAIRDPDLTLSPAASDIYAAVPRPDLEDLRVFDLGAGVAFTGTGPDGRSCIQLAWVRVGTQYADEPASSDVACAIAPLHPVVNTWSPVPDPQGTLLAFPSTATIVLEARGDELLVWASDKAGAGE